MTGGDRPSDDELRWVLADLRSTCRRHEEEAEQLVMKGRHVDAETESRRADRAMAAADVLGWVLGEHRRRGVLREMGGLHL